MNKYITACELIFDSQTPYNKDKAAYHEKTSTFIYIYI